MVQKIIKDQDLLDNQISQALLKIKIKEYNKAKIILEKLQKLNQPDFRIYINLANIYIIQNNINKSLEILNTYLQNFKFEKNIANHLGKLCLNYNLNEQLEQLFDTSKLYLKEEDENKYYLYFLQGKYFEKKGNLEDAISSYILSINSKKEFKNSYIELLNILEKTNNLKLFNHYVNLSLKQFHNDKNNLIFFFYKSLLLNRQNKYEESYALILENKLINNLNENKFNIRLFDLMSKNLDKLGQYKMSFDYIQNRNSLIKNLNENRKYNKNVILNTIQNYKKFFTNKYFNQVNQKLKYDDDSNLVFLVGFPRSGTTLLDTILRTHSRISVLEEQPYLLNIRHSYFKSKNNNLKSLLQITQKEKDQIRTSYLKNFKSEIDSGKIIIDKLPLSIIEIGFIKSIFPKSKIILALRHPYDVVLSCYFSSFKINDAMINFLDLNDTINFYDEVLSLFTFYVNEINLNYIQIKYEKVVLDFESQIKMLLDYLNLDFENSLNKFYLTAKERVSISTPSYNQVINPLYRTSIGRWKNYKNFIDFENKLIKWVRKFNY